MSKCILIILGVFILLLLVYVSYKRRTRNTNIPDKGENKEIHNEASRLIAEVSEVFFEKVYWLYDIVFDTNALFDFTSETLDWIIEEAGSFFTSKYKDGEVGILPNIDEVINLVKKYDVECGTMYHNAVQECKASIAYVADGNGKTQGARIVGSDKGFDKIISNTLQNKNIFASKIKNE